jgi:hypothetical protein
VHLNAFADPPKCHAVCWIAVTGIETLYEQYLPVHAVRSTLEIKRWGLKEFFVQDHFRNLIIFAERISADETAQEQ